MTMSDSQKREFRLTGWHVLAITVSAFAVIITVNVVMAYNAIRTFPGLEVQNSYVASQGFNQRLAEQRALGWTTDVNFVGGRLSIAITDRDGAPAPVHSITAILGRPTTQRDDRTLELTYRDGAFVADVAADYGNWELTLTAQSSGGDDFEQRIRLLHRR